MKSAKYWSKQFPILIPYPHDMYKLSNAKKLFKKEYIKLYIQFIKEIQKDAQKKYT